MFNKSIVIIGSGNIATCFGKALIDAGMSVQAIYSRNFEHAKNLAHLLKAQAVSLIDELPVDADFYMIAVNDSSITEISDQLKVNGIVFHCSGNTSIEAIKSHKNHGVIWPLQTISKNFELNIKAIPLCIEGNIEDTTNTLTDLANTISEKVVQMNSQQRKYAHLAAVFANNFSNHLFDISAQLLKDHQLDFDLLRPLILETARKVQFANPSEMQTGPAIRQDHTTVNEHLKMLNDHPDYKNMYDILSKSIIELNKIKK